MLAHTIEPPGTLPASVLMCLWLTLIAAHPASGQEEISPWIQKHCASCHNEENRESGVRVDHLDDSLPDESLRLWESIHNQIQSGKMPPEDQPQPTADERELFLKRLNDALHLAKTRPTPRNGSMRRLTVSQYDLTLKSLLGIERNLSDVLPPDAVSRDGFSNQANTLAMNPLQLETYFKIAEGALDSTLVDPNTPPAIEFFRMDLGKSLHPNPSNASLILGANNHLLANADFIVSEPELKKPFAFEPFRMQRKFRFIEGYQGNDTVRDWRDFDGIEHAVFACMRGNEGYPKGKAYELLPSGLALRPAIPSPEIFGESSTYGPQANFKISLRELPHRGRFQVRVTASKTSDLLLLDAHSPSGKIETGLSAAISWQHNSEPAAPRAVAIPQDGVYLVQIKTQQPENQLSTPDASKLNEGLLGHWSMNKPDADSPNGNPPIERAGLELLGKATWAESPFGQALSVSGEPSALVGKADKRLGVGPDEFTVSAWIHPQKLSQGGIVCLGGYGYTHGWLLDMPDQRGILRLETANASRQHNGTVQSPPGVLKKDAWQHVCAVVRRLDKQTELFVNGYRVAAGSIQNADLSNPQARLHIGRIENGQGFHGQIDEVRIYNRALAPGEIQALVEPGRAIAKPPEFPTQEHDLRLSLTGPNPKPQNQLEVTALLKQPEFGLVRLSKGDWQIGLSYAGPIPIDRVEFLLLENAAKPSILEDPTTHTANWFEAFERFEARNPKLGVHLGLRRDCGSTLSQVGECQEVDGLGPSVYVFQGDIANFPSPDVETNNVNYLAGIREIGVRHEYTDGRETPRLLIHRVEFEGPFYEAWPPESHRRILSDRLEGQTDLQYAKQVIEQFATRAFRRPLTDIESRELLSVFDSELQAGNSLQSSIRETLLVVLTSPQFLYLTEKSLGPEAEPLNEWELASKLSYFLWNAPPDSGLLSLANENNLRGNLDTQIDRMLVDPRSQAFTDRFVSEWLSLDKFDVVEMDAKRYPHLTRDARKHLRREPIEYFRHMLARNAPAIELVDSQYIVANEVVASYYGLADRTESGFAFVPIKHDSSTLGGVLTQAAPLGGLSDGREANPVKRGAWFARKIIAEPPEDPPPNVPKLEDLTQLSLREKLQRHRDVRGCAQCHAGIDPWGLPFEQFDASGRSRRDRVDSATRLSDGTELADFEAFRAYLVQDRSDHVAFSLAKHLAIYACGRGLTYNETLWMRDHLGQLKQSGYPVADVVRWIIHSDLFDKK